VARRPLTGVLLVGGASTRFGSPKALVQIDGETFADRGRRMLAEACEEVLVVGKRDDALPFDVIDDGTEVRAPIAGVVAGLRAAANEVAVFVPVDCPWMTPAAVRALGDACGDAAVPPSGPLPGAWAKSALQFSTSTGSNFSPSGFWCSSSNIGSSRSCAKLPTSRYCGVSNRSAHFERISASASWPSHSSPSRSDVLSTNSCSSDSIVRRCLRN